eukprot:jgi/Hompol1/4448/HPOL_000210-RA
MKQTDNSAAAEVAEKHRNADEARNLGADLTAVTRENQILNSELVEVVIKRLVHQRLDIGILLFLSNILTIVHPTVMRTRQATLERDQYKAELAECDRQIQYLDELIATKEQEKDQLMASYRKLISEHERLDLSLRMSGENSNNMKMEVVLRDKHVQQLQQALDEANHVISKLKIDLGAFEKQSSNLMRAQATSERIAKQHEQEKRRLERELQQVRDLAQATERSKDSLQKSFAAASLENERLLHQITIATTNLEKYESQLNAEKLRSERIEKQMNSERIRMFQSNQSAAEISSAKSGLETQLQDLVNQQKITIASLNKQLEESHHELHTQGGNTTGLDASIQLDQKLAKQLSQTTREKRQIDKDLAKKSARMEQLPVSGDPSSIPAIVDPGNINTSSSDPSLMSSVTHESSDDFDDGTDETVAQSQQVLGAINQPVDGASFIPGQYFDIGIELHNVGQNSVTYPDLSTLKATINGQDLATFLGSQYTPLENWNTSYFADAPSRDANNATPFSVSRQTLRSIQINAPGTYDVVVTAGTERVQATWTVREISGRTVKNLVLFIGDGMAPSMIAAARYISKPTKFGKFGDNFLEFEKMGTIGKVATNGIDAIITDSANSAAAYLSGQKGWVNGLNVYSDTSAPSLDDPKVETLAEYIRRTRPSMCIGVVTTAEVQDATPAAVYAHTRSRYDPVITDQLISHASFGKLPWSPIPVQPDVLLGGGGNGFCPKTNSTPKCNGAVDYYAKFASLGYNVVNTKTQLDTVGTDKPLLASLN